MDKMLLDVYGHTDRMLWSIENIGESYKQTKNELRKQSSLRK